MLLNKNFFAVFFLVTATYLFADDITVNNKSPRDVYVAIYYTDDDKGDRTTRLYFIEAGTSKDIPRPDRKFKGISWTGFYYDRELVFVEEMRMLKPKLTRKELDQLHALNVGTLKGNIFYIGSKDGRLYGYNIFQWKLIKETVEDLVAKTVTSLLAIKNNPHKETPALVRRGNQLCKEEKEFVAKRRVVVKQTLEKFLGRSLGNSYIPTIAIACSGGGYRSMLYSTGCLRAAQDAGFLDAVMYAVGESGSVWSIGAWTSLGMPIVQFHEWLVGQLDQGAANVSFEQARWIAGMILTKYYNDQAINIVDLYGGLLANALFKSLGGKVQQVHLSEQANRIKNGAWPMPIYTSIAADSLGSESLWYEYTPYEVGAAWLSMYVPSWAFGRKFKVGKSVDFSPEQGFGFVMATCGLAVGITIDRLVEEANLRSKIPIPSALGIFDEILKRTAETRPIGSYVHNFSFGLLNTNYEYMSMRHHMAMTDAAINFNIPYPPISGDRPERKVDIIIVCDASSHAMELELAGMVAYAAKNGYPMPSMDPKRAAKKGVNIFKDPTNPNAPVVIYLPRIVDTELVTKFRNSPVVAKYMPHIINFDVEKCIREQACNTYNFKYTREQALSMSMLGAFNMCAATEQVKEAIEWVIAKKTPKKI